MARKVKIVAIHHDDSCGKEPFRRAMLGKTGVWKKRKVWKDGTVLGVKGYECGDFYFDTPWKIRGQGIDNFMYFYAVSTMPVRR